MPEVTQLISWPFTTHKDSIMAPLTEINSPSFLSSLFHSLSFSSSSFSFTQSPTSLRVHVKLNSDVVGGNEERTEEVDEGENGGR